MDVNFGLSVNVESDIDGYIVRVEGFLHCNEAGGYSNNIVEWKLVFL